MKIAIGQTNTTVGDLRGNTQRMLSFAHDPLSLITGVPKILFELVRNIAQRSSQ